MAILGQAVPQPVGKRPRPNINIQHAENGYIIHRDGHENSKGQWEQPEPYICSNETEVSEAVKAILTGFHPFGN